MMKYILTSALFSLFFLATVQSQVNVSTLESIDSIRIDDNLTVHSDGTIYGSNFVDSNIYSISPSGQISLFVTGIVSPNGHDFDSNGDLIVASFYGNRLWKVSSNGTKTIFVDSLPRPSGVLKMPNSDTMIVTRYQQNLLLKIAPNGTIDTLSIGGALNGPVGLVYDDNNELFVANFNNRKIIHIESNGSQSTLATLPGTGRLGFITYNDGHFYGTAYDQYKIYDVRQSDTLITLLCGTNAGNTDGDITTAQFNRPNGIVMSQTRDSIFVSDYSSGNVRVITGFQYDLGIESEEISLMKLCLFPNPSADELHVNYTLKEAEEFSIRIVMENGSLVHSEDIEAKAGEHHLSINLDHLPNGLYFIHFDLSTASYVKRFVVQKE